MNSKSRYVLISISITFYAVSFFLPTASSSNPEHYEFQITGWEAFRGGWQALLIFEPREPDAWILGAAWLANPLFWVAGVTSLYERRRVASILTWVAVVLCLPVLFRFGEIIVGRPGYWSWLSSMALLTVVNSVRVSKQAKKETS